MEELQTIVALGAGTITKKVYPDSRIERCDNVKDVDLYMSKDYPEIAVRDLASEADKKMYEAKSEYYKKKGIERRRT